MIRATEADLPEIRAFLAARVARAMFPLSNLGRFGLDGPHPYAPRMWLDRPDGTLAGVLTLTRNGSLMPALPRHDWDAAAKVLAGETISAGIGPADEVRPLLAHLGLTGRPAQLNRDEPHFALDLADLVVPPGQTRLTPLSAAPRPLMELWRSAYATELMGEDPATARETGRKDVDAYLAADSHRVLWEGDLPVAMTGFNARLPDIVQIGGVYTPPQLRGRGHARRAVALHLAEARAAGATRATLFSGSPAATRAYRALGFRQIGAWTLCLFRTPAHA